MKIITFFISQLAHGGAERVLVNLANAFAQSGYDVHFITTYRNENEYALLPVIKRQVISESVKLSNMKIVQIMQEILFIRSELQRNGSIYAVTFMANNNFRLILAGLGLKTKSVISVRNAPEREYYNAVLLTAARILFPLAKGIVFQTQEEKAFFPRFIQNKSAIIYNPVLDLFYIQALRKPEKTVVSAGRLEKQKNFSLLIRAFAKIANTFPHHKLIIYGEGSRREQLEHEILELGLKDRISLPGRVDDMQVQLGKAEVFVMPSNFEGMPNVLMESMAVGLPVISTNCPAGGPGEIIMSGCNGLLIPVNDVDELVKQLSKVLSNSELRENLSNNARITAEKFRSEHILEQWQTYLKGL